MPGVELPRSFSGCCYVAPLACCHSGALVVKNESASLLEKRYFGGGTIEMATVRDHFVHVFKKKIWERYSAATMHSGCGRRMHSALAVCAVQYVGAFACGCAHVTTIS